MSILCPDARLSGHDGKYSPIHQIINMVINLSNLQEFAKLEHIGK